ncbi:hypothetical protein ACH5RR_017291 [Cinchona calisaya]|uniref:Transcription factor IIIC 90kDa subunit N-terminal domain-containing protein n=1 Tax=Cinchona calisaya TaxID=153742 RepID=A0ABD2ZYF9_9GENT
MSQRFQAAALVASPCYPDSVVWSDDNLLAVASGHLVTILNPANPFGPRGLITLPASKPFTIGVIDREDILSPCLLPTSLSRDVRPCVRSISWSPIGFAPNAGCLLAVCSTVGCVRVYRMPYCEFSAEWIEVMDISEMLYTYLASVNFEESDLLSSGIAEELTNQAQMDQNCADSQLISVTKEHMQNKEKALTAIDGAPGNMKNNSVHDIVTLPSRGKRKKKALEVCTLPLITVEQFASRSAMLASLIVAWSPVLLLSAGVEEASANNIPSNCSVLAVGGKSGRISLWRVHQPQCYTTMNVRESITSSFIGFLQAHDSWVTALSWELFVSDASNPQLLLATGSSNGSVKIWKAYVKELLNSLHVSHVPFSLLKEVVTIDCGTVSVLSLILSKESLGKMLLAVGRGSGSLEVWVGNLHSSNFEKAHCPKAHEHIVTGLAWAFGTNCLYSCSQDDTIRSWILLDNILSEVPLPSNTTCVGSPSDVPYVYDLCFGLAVSPGNLAMAVAHSFDTDLLNPMYQARTQKAAVEFLWIGGQQRELTLNAQPDFEVEAFPAPERELISWENNILWSFNQYEHANKPLVMWDVVAALLAFRQSIPNYVEHILLKWTRSFLGSHFDVSPAISSEISKFLSNLTSRQLHILNIISRRVFRKQLKADQTNSKQDFEGLDGAEKQQNFWLKLVCESEKELRGRLLYFSFSAILRIVSKSATEFREVRHWTPVGLRQMMQWVASNPDDLKDHVKLLAEEVGKIEKSGRLHSMFEYAVEERCSFCSAAVPFESAEVAFCQGVKNNHGVGKSHKLARCAVSMMVCPITPTWFCICCHRYASTLAPQSLFSMPKYPLDFTFMSESSNPEESTKPLCPFCGILLQRLQPEFLLSPSPV